MQANQAYVALLWAVKSATKPKTRVAIVTCMDSRLHVAQALGLAPWGCSYLADAGGRVTEDMIRSLVISSNKWGQEKSWCFTIQTVELETFQNESFHEHLKHELGVDVSSQDFFTIPGC